MEFPGTHSPQLDNPLQGNTNYQHCLGSQSYKACMSSVEITPSQRRQTVSSQIMRLVEYLEGESEYITCLTSVFCQKQSGIDTGVIGQN